MQIESLAELNDLIDHIYPELKRRARWLMSRERTGHTFGQSGSELVQRMLEKVLAGGGFLFKAALTEEDLIQQLARQMRFILVDYARRNRTTKRINPHLRADLDGVQFRLAAPIINIDEILSVDEALRRLSADDPAGARALELRYFGGLTNEEAASAMAIPVARFRRLMADANVFMRVLLEPLQTRRKACV